MSFEPITYSTFLAKGIIGHIIYPEGTSTNLGIMLIAAAVIISAAAAYFLGSLNFGIIISKVMFKDDIRKRGSGNAGMTNMLRTYGKSAAVCTLLGDVLKAALSVYIGFALCGRMSAGVAGVFCMIGHIFPVYYGFRGGKGVLTAIVMILFLYPIAGVILLAMFAIIVLFTKYVSLGSVMCAILYPLIVHRINTIQNIKMDIVELTSAFIVMFIIIFMHRSNIKRLLEGKEKKISIGKKGKKKGEDETSDEKEDK